MSLYTSGFIVQMPSAVTSSVKICVPAPVAALHFPSYNNWYALMSLCAFDLGRFLLWQTLSSYHHSDTVYS